MSCTDCFSGCVETTSDKCVKYTGNNIEFLGIQKGDTLESVEKAITDYLLTVYTGEGIFPTISENWVCEFITPYLTGDPLTLVDVLSALLQGVCALNDLITAEKERIDAIEANYTIPDCLSIAGDLKTHDTLQAVITKLCEAVGDIDTLYSLYATCITTATISSYIQNYLNSITTNNLMYTKMVPYAVYPFYPSAAIMAGAFDVNGVGIPTSIWQKVYLCNGYNGLTPDLRGRSIIGMVAGMGGGALDPEVDPANGHTNYTQGEKNGQNSVVLTASQIAAHNHTPTVTLTDPGHHTTIDLGLSGRATWDTDGLPVDYAQPVVSINTAEGTHAPAVGASDYRRIVTSPIVDTTGITITASIADNSPAGQSHTNIHPVLATYYIMYVP